MTTLLLFILLGDITVSLVAERWVVIHTEAIGRDTEWWMMRAGCTVGSYSTLLAENTETPCIVMSILMLCSIECTHGWWRQLCSVLQIRCRKPDHKFIDECCLCATATLRPNWSQMLPDNV